MRIAQVVTYASADSAFGGPLTVATMQTEELARRGHTVDLFCGWDGRDSFAADGVSIRRFRARHLFPGMSGLFAPGLHRSLAESIRDYDVVHVHMGRDLITAAAARQALRSGVNYVVQPHGMIGPDSRLRAQIADSLVVRAALEGAGAVLTLGSGERKGIEEVSRGRARVVTLGNGIDRYISSKERDPTLVVFLARLHARKRVLTFVEAAHQLAASRADLRFEVWGPDEGELSAMLSAIADGPASDRITYRGASAPGQSRSILAGAAVYVLPSRGEVFPMTVLEAMSVGTPVVMTHDSEISPQLRALNAAVVVDGSPRSIARGIDDVTSQPERRLRVLAGAEQLLRAEYSIAAVTDRLELIYASATRPSFINTEDLIQGIVNEQPSES